MNFRNWTGVVCLLALGGGAIGATAAESSLPEYEIARTTSKLVIDGKFDEPAWLAAPAVGEFLFPWHEAGAREQSLVKLVWDDNRLYIASLCEDRHITVKHQKHDEPVASDDCLEIMFAPSAARPAFYFNVEWNVIGGYVDGHRPNGPDAPRIEWNAEGLELVGSFVGTLNDDADVDEYWAVEVAIPWRNFESHLVTYPPQVGDEFRANFNRHGGETNQQYSQWSEADTPVPAFHVPHRFGLLRLSGETVPFATQQ
jgi:hypothetical protein